MADTAAHLVDHVFPEVPVRQWVLSVPFKLRYRLAYDSSLVRDVLQIFVRAVFASIRRRAGMAASNRKARCCAVGFIQRFSDALNLDPHFHLMALDGIYIDDSKDNPAFRRVGPPTDAEVARVAERVHRRVLRLIEQRGLGPQADPEEAYTLRRDQSAACRTRWRINFGARSNWPTRRQAHCKGREWAGFRECRNETRTPLCLG